LPAPSPSFECRSIIIRVQPHQTPPEVGADVDPNDRWPFRGIVTSISRATYQRPDSGELPPGVDYRVTIQGVE
jgi:hypothetical protein